MRAPTILPTDPVERAVYEGTKNIIRWKDAPGAAVPDWPETIKARSEVEQRVRQEWKSKVPRNFEPEHAA